MSGRHVWNAPGSAEYRLGECDSGDIGARSRRESILQMLFLCFNFLLNKISNFFSFLKTKIFSHYAHNKLNVL